jgi:Tol biopolymer transport system component
MCPSPKVPGSLDTPPPEAVRAELDRILGSEIFRRTERLSAFLKFIVERTIAGEGGSLKEQVIAVDLYGKEPAFNTAADPIVRVDARRLRDRLREYYVTNAGTSVVISLPKGSYTPTFSTTVTTPDAGVVAVSPAGHPRWRRPAAIAALLAASVAALVIAARPGRRTESPRLLTVTSLPGAEEDPSLSPDGNSVAFNWTPHADAISHIWIKTVDGDASTQLTNTSDGWEQWPAWSPDGRLIAFTRHAQGKSLVVVVSPFGGPELVVGATEAEGGAQWTPDSTSLVFSRRVPEGGVGLVRHVLETGEETMLTSPPKSVADSRGRVSPDGTTVLFVRWDTGRAALFLKRLTATDATQITEWYSVPLGGIAWMPDGREFLYSRPGVSGRQLVRMKIGDADAVPVSGLQRESVGPSLSRVRPDGTYRLAVAAGQADIGLRLIDLHSSLRNGSMATDSPFCEGTRMDMPGRFSPDGNQVAFSSDRGGSFQVWVANRDGSGLHSLTRLEDALVNVGSWSPDGRSIAFDATTREEAHIYVVQADSGLVTKLTSAQSNDIDPEWSKDGKWIYYSSTRAGVSAVWKVPSTGGDPVRVTSEMGFEPRESPDGRTIYFVDHRRGYSPGSPRTLRAVSVEGGPSREIPAAVIPGAWDVTDAGILFLRRPPAPEAETLALYEFGTGHVQQVASLAVRVSAAGSRRYLSASRDGQWAVLSHLIRWERDILVLDNFR